MKSATYRIAIFLFTLHHSPFHILPAAPVILDETGAANLGIQTEVALHADFAETLFAIGRIEPLPQNKSLVSSRISGRVTKIHAYESDIVQSGQAVVEIESLQPGSPPPTISLTASLGGMIMRNHTHLGKPVTPDAELFEIIALAQVYAVARIPEEQASRLSIGNSATIKVASIADETFMGELVRFGVEADIHSGTLDALFLIANPQNRLRPNMRVEFSIQVAEKTDALSIPIEAIQNDGLSRFVFVKDFDLKHAYHRTPVKLGMRNDLRVEVLGGLFPGDEVVTQGSYALISAGGSSGISLKEALDAAHGHEHNEDGSEMTPAQRAARLKEKQAAGGGGTDSGPLTLFFSILSGALFILLILSLMIRGRKSELRTQQKEVGL
ncbi:MAG: efflux RND transporter periplasmic adaptor subunit [Verrucomicrobiota bacterium]